MDKGGAKAERGYPGPTRGPNFLQGLLGDRVGQPDRQTDRQTTFGRSQ